MVRSVCLCEAIMVRTKADSAGTSTGSYRKGEAEGIIGAVFSYRLSSVRKVEAGHYICPAFSCHVVGGLYYVVP